MKDVSSTTRLKKRSPKKGNKSKPDPKSIKIIILFMSLEFLPNEDDPIREESQKELIEKLDYLKKNKVRIDTELTYYDFLIKCFNSKFFQRRSYTEPDNESGIDVEYKYFELKSKWILQTLLKKLIDFSKSPCFTTRSKIRFNKKSQDSENDLTIPQGNKKIEDFIKKIMKGNEGFLKFLGKSCCKKNLSFKDLVIEIYKKYYRKKIKSLMEKYENNLLNYANKTYPYIREELGEVMLKEFVKKLKSFNKVYDFEIEDRNELGFIRIYFASGPYDFFNLEMRNLNAEKLKNGIKGKYIIKN